MAESPVAVFCRFCCRDIEGIIWRVQRQRSVLLRAPLESRLICASVSPMANHFTFGENSHASASGRPADPAGSFGKVQSGAMVNGVQDFF